LQIKENKTTPEIGIIFYLQTPYVVLGSLKGWVMGIAKHFKGVSPFFYVYLFG
tara:strand:- start:395 stop:553 length:159 start_codon:yes stop_codon:yes gene_type:complete